MHHSVSLSLSIFIFNSIRKSVDLSFIAASTHHHLLLLLLLLKMPKNTRKLPSSSSSATPNLKPPQHDSSAHNPNAQNNCLSPPNHQIRSLVCALSRSGSTKFPIFRNHRVPEVSAPRRRSLRLSLLKGHPNANQPVNDNTSSCNAHDKQHANLKGEEEQVEIDTSNRRSKARATSVRACETNESEISNHNNRKKRQREEGVANVRVIVEGWTKEQEMDLQRAYFTIKPTPNFWKKVSKLVPGKSAQDCFDKVNSDHMTPPQALPRSRAKRINSSPLESSLLSASKLLNPSGPKSKLSRKQKSHNAHKKVRELLQKQNTMDRDYEADLFAILEPNMNPSTQDPQLAVQMSTPKHSQEEWGFLHKFHDRSSSGHKKSLSRMSSCGIDIASPPVLKQVKNRALHDKYIDQLHRREAKRKAAYARAGKSVTGKENMGEINVQKIDAFRSAKNFLVSDVRDAINQLQDLQANASSSSDFDGDGVGTDDDGGESGLEKIS